jgi:hypothetical protein
MGQEMSPQLFSNLLTQLTVYGTRLLRPAGGSTLLSPSFSGV